MCIWHIHRTWLKIFIEKVKDYVPHRELFKCLGEIMHISPNENVIISSRIKLLEKHKEQVIFVKYFNDHWIERIGMWESFCCTIPHIVHETNNVIESYHSHLKSIWLKSICATVHMRVD